MARKKKIVINTEVKDALVSEYLKREYDSTMDERKRYEKQIASSVVKVVDEARRLYQRSKNKSIMAERKLYPIKEAYAMLRKYDYPISIRAFGGRIERGTIPSFKIGKLRYVPLEVVNDMINLNKSYYTIRRAYEEYSKYNKYINYRAFIGRVEKGSFPSLKISTKRLIPREVIDVYANLAKNYHTVSQAMEELQRRGIRVRRNAFERRLDRGTIPCIKVAGRRYIHKDVMRELVEKEIEYAARKAA